MARLRTDPHGVLFAHPHGPRIWDYFREFTTQQTNTEIHAGVKDQSLYITDIFLQVNAAVNITLIEGGLAASATNTKFKFIGSTQSDGVSRSYKVPKKLRPGMSLTVTTSGAVTVEVEVHGFVAP